VLVVCRRDDFLTWETELALERQLAPFVIDSSDVNLGDATEHIYGEECKWVLVTYDLMKNPVIGKWVEGVLFGIVIADESHMIKRWSSARTKAVIRRTRHIPERLALTGSPITNQPRDVFSQCLFIDDGKTFGDNEWRFLERYYIRSGPGWYVKRTAKKDIAKRLNRIAFYVDEDDVLKLPPKRFIIKGVEMSSRQTKAYKQVLEDWEILVNGEVFEIDQAIVQLAKMKQIASGFIYDQEHNAVWLNSTKVKLLFDLLTDDDYLGAREKVVVWCSFTAEIEKIAQMAASKGIKAVTFYGSKRRQKERARKEFKHDRLTRLFIGQVDAGVGMNELVVARDAVYFSNSFKVVSRQQSMRRIRRIGSEQHKRITYWDLCSEDSVDRHILQAVNQKMDFASLVLSRLRESRNVNGFLH